MSVFEHAPAEDVREDAENGCSVSCRCGHVGVGAHREEAVDDLMVHLVFSYGGKDPRIQALSWNDVPYRGGLSG